MKQQMWVAGAAVVTLGEQGLGFLSPPEIANFNCEAGVHMIFHDLVDLPFENRVYLWS